MLLSVSKFLEETIEFDNVQSVKQGRACWHKLQGSDSGNPRTNYVAYKGNRVTRNRKLIFEEDQD